jgi:hypothetical protein
MNTKLLNLSDSGGLQITGFSQVTNTSVPSMTVTVTGDPGVMYTMTNVSGDQTIPPGGSATHVISWSRPTCTNQTTNVSSTITAIAPAVVASGVPTTVTSSSVSGTTSGGTGVPPTTSNPGNIVLSSGGTFSLVFSGGSNCYRALGRISSSNTGHPNQYFSPWSKNLYPSNGTFTNSPNNTWTVSWVAAGSGNPRSILMNFYYSSCYSGSGSAYLPFTVSTV